MSAAAPLDRWAESARKLRLPGLSKIDLAGPPDLVARLRKGHAASRRDAREAFARGDAGGMLCSFSNEHGFSIVYKNTAALLERGIYEAALVEAYIGTRTNWSAWPLDLLGMLILSADPDRLRAAGDPIPPGDAFTLYRGVAGAGDRRKERGLSWSRSRETAEWFAQRGARCGLADPAVYVTEVQREAITFYSGKRKEDDFVLIADQVERVEWSPAT